MEYDHFATLIYALQNYIDRDAASLNIHATAPADERLDCSYDLERICRAKSRKHRYLPRSLATRLFAAATRFELS